MTHKAQHIDGTLIAEEIHESVKNTIAESNITPHLAIVLVGETPESLSYIAIKKKRAESVGIMFALYKLPEKSKEEEIIETITFLNNDPDIHGVMVQLPLPKHINTQNILNHIEPSKDVDCLNPHTIEKYTYGQDCFEPPLAGALRKCLEYTNVRLDRKRALIITKNKPLADVLSFACSMYSIIPKTHLYGTDHSVIENESFDIIITVVGAPHSVTHDMLKHCSIVIDMSFIKKPDGTITSDTDQKEVERTVEWMTTVPGGAGPITVALLLKNTLDAALDA